MVVKLWACKIFAVWEDTCPNFENSLLSSMCGPRDILCINLYWGIVIHIPIETESKSLAQSPSYDRANILQHRSIACAASHSHCLACWPLQPMFGTIFHIYYLVALQRKRSFMPHGPSWVIARPFIDVMCRSLYVSEGGEGGSRVAQMMFNGSLGISTRIASWP